MSSWSRALRAVPGTWRLWLPWAGALFSGVLLASLFPPFQSDDAAWVALVPLLLTLRRGSRLRAFRLGMVTGTLAWLVSIFWLTRVTWIGWAILSLYCALYIGLFAVLARDAFAAWGTRNWWSNLGLMLVLALAWMGLEYLRATVATGFAWNLLGVSQYERTALIQVARLGGVYVLSGLIVVVNTAVVLTVCRYTRRGGSWRRTPHLELLAALALFAAATLYGFSVLRQPPAPSIPLRVGLVQPNIPQYEKWTAAFVRKIYAALEDLSRDALRFGRLDLLVWPETAVPDDLRYSEQAHRLVMDLAGDYGVALLAGSMDTAWPDLGPPTYYNSSLLFNPRGQLLEQYDKQHLVLFGEYVPFEHRLPFLKAMTPIPSSVTPGRRPTVFQLEARGLAFSVLICFEDTVAPLAREMVQRGARLLVNQTNDAWFDPHAGSRQHLAQGVFRAVENGVPLVRCANTGVTCVINAHGRIEALLEGPGGSLNATGFLTSEVDVPLVPPDTPWLRWGSAPVAGCAGAVLLYGVWLVGQGLAPGSRRRRNGPSGHEAG